MESLLIVLITVLIVMNAGMFFFLIKRKPEVKEDKTEQLFKDEINSLRNSLANRLDLCQKI